MSDLVDQYRRELPGMSDQEKADALKVVEEQIKATLQHVQTAANPIGNALSRGYQEAWNRFAEKYRRDLEELEELKRLLES
jgi:uncharacterized protein YeaO (DUF488 family)